MRTKSGGTEQEMTSWSHSALRSSKEFINGQLYTLVFHTIQSIKLPCYLSTGFALQHKDQSNQQGEPGEQGWRSGESTHFPLNSRILRHMWVEFVGSLLCSERFFPGYSSFPLSSKTNICRHSSVG